MESTIKQALDLAVKLGATYTDIRWEEVQSQNIQVKNENVEAIHTGLDAGYGVRVIKNGAWGFASCNTVSSHSLLETVRRSIAIAETSSTIAKQDIKLAKVEIHNKNVSSPAKIDPFSIGLSEKIDLLTQATRNMAIDPIIVFRYASISLRKIHKIFASSEGSFIEQERIETGCGINAFARGTTDIQNRAYPNAFGGDFSTFGWEFVCDCDLLKNAPQCAEEALALAKAPVCPNGVQDIIIMGNQMALQIHESIGHPNELDRVFGFEAAYAGTSYMTLDKLGTSKIASEQVDITADATIPGAFGYFAFDDEGVPGQRVYLIQKGILTGYLNSRETAALLGQKPMGAMRADGFSNYPLIRMTSVNLEPGSQTLEELVAGVEKGVLFDGIKSWSIDDRRLNFQFGTQLGRVIHKGKLGEIVKNPTYTGVSTSFWNSCDAIGNKDLWRLYGVPNCGKGEPSQMMKLSHGTAPARFRNVKVGISHE